MPSGLGTEHNIVFNLCECVTWEQWGSRMHEQEGPNSTQVIGREIVLYLNPHIHYRSNIWCGPPLPSRSCFNIFLLTRQDDLRTRREMEVEYRKGRRMEGRTAQEKKCNISALNHLYSSEEPQRSCDCLTIRAPLAQSDNAYLVSRIVGRLQYWLRLTVHTIPSLSLLLWVYMRGGAVLVYEWPVQYGDFSQQGPLRV
ncbi:uncharacterized protein BDR25DRAFT_352279 [Lindgomyces ingoldianus]|uniref:Uncharacterized protein n=1 Tax=Lindgomyces ingoldianus TaxID=673940 RepID=A0ACB6R3C8_9PLEO|nr:uncharacterized protein BDR25DRAFT_352279 [Lindgomyces ingoldianus]KAF2473793.1 hypothetical protein BDR25DRAFT_352279 [Lindgomyces ingoldianus]